MKEPLALAVKITPAILPSAGVAAATDLNGAVLDMAGFDGVMVIVNFGVITANAVTGVKFQQGATSNLADAADILGSAQVVADDGDDKVWYIDTQRITKRYVRVVVTRATQNAVVSSATYLQYGPREKPVTHAANVAGEKFVDPTEGTA